MLCLSHFYYFCPSYEMAKVLQIALGKEENSIGSLLECHIPSSAFYCNKKQSYERGRVKF